MANVTLFTNQGVQVFFLEICLCENQDKLGLVQNISINCDQSKNLVPMSETKIKGSHHRWRCCWDRNVNAAEFDRSSAACSGFAYTSDMFEWMVVLPEVQSVALEQ